MVLLDFLKKFFRFTVSEETSFKTLFSFKIKLLSFLFYFLFFLMMGGLFYFVLFSYTPLKKTIPGYKEILLNEEFLKAGAKIDSLCDVVSFKNQQLEILKKILTGEEIQDSINTESHLSVPFYNVNKIIEDSILRQEIELEENINYSYDVKIKNLKNLVFFNPLEGLISSGFNKEAKHFGIDIVGKKEAFFKSVFDGVVIFVDWGELDGGVVVVGHPFGITSVYKHASKTVCSVGEPVKAGDVLGVVGNSGKLSIGPHLHFEMWLDGEVLNPERFLFY